MEYLAIVQLCIGGTGISVEQSAWRITTLLGQARLLLTHV
jgi:hypothetical protein